MRKLDKYGRKLTNKQCVLCQYYGSIFEFTNYNNETPVCHSCASEAIEQATKPRYPVPTTIGFVSLGVDYPGVCFIDSADWENPVILWGFDTWELRELRRGI